MATTNPRERQAATSATAIETPKHAPKIRVTVKRDRATDYGYVVTSSIQPLPRPSALLDFVDKTKRKIIQDKIAWGGDTLLSVMSSVGSRVTCAEWASAIAREAFTRAPENDSASIEMQHISDGGYLALDSGIYKLLPVGMAPASRVLTLLKHKYSQKAQMEAKRQIVSATQQADTILAAAAEKMREADRIRAELASTSAPPPWAIASSMMMRHIPPAVGGYFPEGWYFGFLFNAVVTSFYLQFHNATGQFVTKRWNATPQPAVPTLCWVRVDNAGDYHYRKISVDLNFKPLPHTSHEASCMELGDAPRQIKSAAHLLALQNSFARCMSQVDLGSLLRVPDHWHPNLIAAIPRNLQGRVTRQQNSNLSDPAIRADNETVLDPDADANETFHITTPAAR